VRSASPSAHAAASADADADGGPVPLGQRPWYEIARMSLESPSPSAASSPAPRARARPASVSASVERAEIGMLVDEWIDAADAPPAQLAPSAADASRTRAARLEEWLRSTSAQAEAEAEVVAHGHGEAVAPARLAGAQALGARW
jgi:hypothetical protein